MFLLVRAGADYKAVSMDQCVYGAVAEAICKEGYAGAGAFSGC